MGHFEPTAYNSSSPSQKADTEYFLHKYGHFINFRENAIVLDLGCGDGYVTINILGKYLEHKYKKLIGVDSNVKMIKYAEATYGNYNREFHVMDVVTKDLPEEFESNFDCVFSFYCFMWVHKEQELVLSNINRMLKVGGDTFFIFVAQHPIYWLYEKMAKYSKYAKYMENLRDIVPIYHEYTNKEEWYRSILKENGFEINTCRVVDMSFTYPSVEAYTSMLIRL